MNDQTSRKPLLGEIFNLMDVVGGGVAWTGEKISSYFVTLKRLAIVVSLVGFCDVLLFIAAAILDSRFVMTITLVTFGIIFLALLLFSGPLLIGAAGLAERYPAFRLTINALAAVALFILLNGLVISIFPVSGKNATVIFVGSLILSLIWFVSGVRPDLTFLKTKVISLIVLSVVVPVLSQQFPETTTKLRDKWAELDRWSSETIEGTPTRLNISTLSHFQKIPFFQGKSVKIYYAINEKTGEYELFDRPGVHPTYQKELKPITPDIVRSIEKRLSDPGRSNAPDRPEPPAVKPVSPSRSAFEYPSSSHTTSAIPPAQQDPPVPPETVIETVGLTVSNQDCREQQVFLDNTQIGTVPGRRSRFFSFDPGRHTVHTCISGTSECFRQGISTWEKGEIRIALRSNLNACRN